MHDGHINLSNLGSFALAYRQACQRGVDDAYEGTEPAIGFITWCGDGTIAALVSTFNASQVDALRDAYLKCWAVRHASVAANMNALRRAQ